MLMLLVHRAPSGTVSVAVAARLIDVSINQTRRIAAELADRGLVRVSRADQVELTVPSIEDRLALADLSAWYIQDRALVLDALMALRRPAS